MPKLKLIFLLTILNAQVFGQENRFPILKENLWGYIDEMGKEVIPTQFKYVGQFSEGLAPVRQNGTFGYIDKLGNFIIKPTFDYALPFESGQAMVYISAKPYFIDSKGKVTFQHNFKSIRSFKNHSYTVAKTHTNKYCLINRQGILITDTIFSNIHYFSNGVAVVNGLKHMPDSKISGKEEVFEVGLIDSTGKWLVKYGKYKDINLDFKNGFATAERFDQSFDEKVWTHRDAVLDVTGKMKFIVPVEKYFLEWEFEGFYDGLAVISMPPKNKQNYSEYYNGVINTDGEILFSDSNWRKITPFTYRRALVKDKNGKWKMINTNGLQVGDSTYENILNEPDFECDTTGIFTDGIAWVKLSNGWVKIDTLGKILSQPKVFENISDSRLQRIGDFIIIGKDNNFENRNKYYYKGFWNSKTNAYVKPVYDYIGFSNTNKNLIYATKNDSSYYLNANGKVIWQNVDSKTSKPYNLNIHYMNESYFYVYREFGENEITKITNKSLDSMSRGFYTTYEESGKNFTKNSKDSNLNSNKKAHSVTFAKNKLSVIVDPKVNDTIYGNKNAIPVYIGNTTNKKIEFYIENYRLFMQVQAINSKGEWKDIEFLPGPHPWKKDNYNSWELPSKYYWTFLTPMYEGEIKTKLRIKLRYIDPADKSYNFWGKKEIIVYSNEYEGSINRGQYWNKLEN